MSDRVKRSTKTNEANRRLSNLDEEVKVGEMEDIAKNLKRAGYSECFRHEAFRQLAKELTRMCQEELRGSSISMTVQERGGRGLGQELGVAVSTTIQTFLMSPQSPPAVV